MKRNCWRGVLAIALILSIPSFVLASGDVQGRFTGKVACVGGKKAAEFKVPGAISPIHSSAQDIKRRVDFLTWHGLDEGSSFSDRENEKTELQHALKMLRDLSCEEAPDTGTTPDTMPAPPALTPKP